MRGESSGQVYGLATLALAAFPARWPVAGIVDPVAKGFGALTVAGPRRILTGFPSDGTMSRVTPFDPNDGASMTRCGESRQATPASGTVCPAASSSRTPWYSPGFAR